MGGIRKLAKLQYGLESSVGVAVAATAQWRGKSTLEDARSMVSPPEDWGIIQPPFRTYQPRLLAKIAWDGPATFEQLPVVLSCGVEALETGVQDGTGPYAYDFDFGTTSANTPKTRTFRGGDNQRVDIVEYGFVTDFHLSGKGGEAWMLKANWNGRQCTDGDFTNSITPAVVEECLFGKSTFSIDPSGGTIGATPKTSTLLATTIDVITGCTPRYTGDGSTASFYDIRTNGAVITGSITLEHDATGETELGIARAATQNAAAASCVRLLRWKTLGTTIAGGSTYTAKTLMIDLPVVYTAVPTLADQDSDSVITLPWRVVSDTMTPQIIVANALSALT